MSSEWDRHKTWNPQVEELFFRKLERAKYKQESLRVQASLLEFGFPDVCLRLAEQYFTFPNRFRDSFVFNSKARALLALGNLDGAIDAYLNALQCEERVPNWISLANLEYPLLIASRRIVDRFVHAFEVSGRRLSVETADEAFSWHCAKGLILWEAEERALAAEHSLAALAAANALTSERLQSTGIGLICQDYIKVLERLTEVSKS